MMDFNYILGLLVILLMLPVVIAALESWAVDSSRKRLLVKLKCSKHECKALRKEVEFLRAELRKVCNQNIELRAEAMHRNICTVPGTAPRTVDQRNKQ